MRSVRKPSRGWYLLLLLPLAGLLYPPLYAVDEPELFGFPFFYWYQFAWVPVASALTWIVYRKTRPERHGAPAEEPRMHAARRGVPVEER